MSEPTRARAGLIGLVFGTAGFAAGAFAAAASIFLFRIPPLTDENYAIALMGLGGVLGASLILLAFRSSRTFFLTALASALIVPTIYALSNAGNELPNFSSTLG